MKLIHQKRLRKLVEVLREVAKPKYRGHFSMYSWLRGNPKTIARTECCTAACAAGWYAVITKHKGLLAQMTRVFRVTTTLSLHFGITYEEARHTFIPDEYHRDRRITASVVRRRVESLMKKYGVKP